MFWGASNPPNQNVSILLLVNKNGQFLNLSNPYGWVGGFSPVQLHNIWMVPWWPVEDRWGAKKMVICEKFPAMAAFLNWWICFWQTWQLLQKIDLFYVPNHIYRNPSLELRSNGLEIRLSKWFTIKANFEVQFWNSCIYSICHKGGLIS